MWMKEVHRYFITLKEYFINISNPPFPNIFNSNISSNNSEFNLYLAYSVFTNWYLSARRANTEFPCSQNRFSGLKPCSLRVPAIVLQCWASHTVNLPLFANQCMLGIQHWYHLRRIQQNGRDHELSRSDLCKVAEDQLLLPHAWCLVQFHLMDLFHDL